jgi:FixJ family two-component response regulator
MDHVVFIVDDDPSVRESLVGLVGTMGLNAVSFESAADYVHFPESDVPACLLLDVNLPDMNGLEFQRQLANRAHPPIIFISGKADVPTSVRALKAGALNFLTKPLVTEDLIEAIRDALEQDRKARHERSELARLQARASQLTPRERQVFSLVISGLLNKQSAAELGISQVTLQIHRGKIMQKMKAESLADLVRIGARLGIPLVHPTTGAHTNT